MPTRPAAKSSKAKPSTKPEVVELDDELVEELEDELELEEEAPAPKKKTKATAKKPADDEEADDELPDRDTYTAKQVATRIGTDAKTLRKFFRSAASTVEPVGQGGRYEFDAEDMPQIKKEFDGWNTTRPTRGRPANADKAATKKSRTEVADEMPEEEELDLDDELEDEPTEDDLDEIEDDLDLEDEK